MKKLGMGKLASISFFLAVALVSVLVVPALAGGSKVYSVTMNAVPGTNPGEFTLTFIVTNDSSGSAVLGSANITAPTGVSLGTPSAPTASGGKTWKATVAGQVIKLTAVGDLQKIAPGESVQTTIDATITAGPGTYTFSTQAKASTGFSGSSFFTRIGSDPKVTVCSTSCSVSDGNVNNPPPGEEVGSFSLDGSCNGCIDFIGATLGDYCSTPNPNPPNSKCKAPLGPQFDVDPSYSGFATFILACDKSNCPAPPTPTCSPCTTAGALEVGNYPVFYTESNAPTTTAQFIQTLPACSEGSGFPCVSDQQRISEGAGAGDLQTTITLCFNSDSCSGSVLVAISDPRLMH